MEEITKEDKASPIKLTEMLCQVTTNLQPEIINGKELYKIYLEKSSERQYEDEAVVDISDRVTIITQAPSVFIPNKRTSLLWFWSNYLWPCYTFTTWWKGSKNINIRQVAFFPVDTPATNLILNNSLRVVLLHKTRCIEAFDVDISKLDSGYWDNVQPEYLTTYVQEIKGAKSYVYWSLVSQDTKIASAELEKGWANQLNSWLKGVVLEFKEGEKQEIYAKEFEIIAQSQFAHLFDKDNILARIYWEFVRLFWKDQESPIDFWGLIQSELSDAPITKTLMHGLMNCAWFSAIGTEQGKSFMSIELDGSRQSVPLVEHLPVDCTKHFWQRIALSLPMYHKQLLGAGSCPMDFEVIKNELPIYQGDINKGKEFLSSLIMEAVSYKQWTIPHGAYIQMEVGPFKAIKIFELNDDVACILVDTSGHYCMVWVNPYRQDFAFVHDQIFHHEALIEAIDVGVLETIMKSSTPKEEINGIAKQEADKEVNKREMFDVEHFRLGIKIILAAIIRDFWVVDERERVFGRGIQIRKSARLRADWGKKSIVYLPRIRYVGDVTRGEEQLHVVARKAHFVVGHLRKAMHASEQQIMIAHRHGITVPEGFTFIRPHKRGDKVQERIYRSRSALQCLSALKSVEKTEADDWFTYELNVKNWLKDNGFDVEHLAGNKNGDGGVDIQASKGDENLLIQCKFWITHKVGPNVVREMLGTLQTFPPGSKGVIITSSEITEGAKALAIDHGIQFIERANFSKKIEISINRS